MGAAVKIVREGKVDKLAVVVMTTMLASIGVSLITGNTRFLLAKDGWITGGWGLLFLLSVRGAGLELGFVGHESEHFAELVDYCVKLQTQFESGGALHHGPGLGCRFEKPITNYG